MKFDIINEARHVEDQRDEGFCYPIAVSDTTSIMYRRLGHEGLVLSPQVLIDAKCGNNAFPFLRHPYGLQARDAYPFTMTKPSIDDNVVLRYNDNKPRYYVHQMSENKDPSTFKSVLEENFGNPRKQNPLIGCMKMGPFKYARDFRPYTHDRTNQLVLQMIRDEPLHAMVIVGVDTDHGKRNCVVKNSYGEDWGKNGFGQVSINDLISIEVIEL